MDDLRRCISDVGGLDGLSAASVSALPTAQAGVRTRRLRREQPLAPCGPWVNRLSASTSGTRCVDEQDRVSGVVERAEAIRQGRLHRLATIVCRDEDGRGGEGRA
ncbi:hypothetical protein CP972_15600 [Streptomyces prasinus]|uniref:Uncharacterized protein n=1 Tax=Streptomyces prasinus TaxID=67345 RepID=A0ABX6AXU6_9ACTN|nr:hypothetical protein CP972_15600 [Streptomyces prasinus]